MIAKRLDEALAARNKLYEASQQHHLEICDMKCQIKNLEEERSKLQEENSSLLKQLQTAQACKHSIFWPDFALSYHHELLDQASSVSLPRTGVIRKTKLLGTNPVGLPKM